AGERAEALRSRTESAASLKLAKTDELTGAWTRKFGLEEVSRELERAHRTGATLVLAFVDVDGLKQVNDTRGHLAGDALLKLVVSFDDGGRQRVANILASGTKNPCKVAASPRSRKPLSVFGGSRVRIPPPPLNQAGLESRPAATDWLAVSRTFPASPWKSVGV